MRSFTVVFALLSLLSASVVAATNASGIDYPSVWECDQSKFYWYCEVHEEEEKQQAQSVEPLVSPQNEAVSRLENLQKELKAKRALAIVNPTPENVAAYIELQNQSMEMASMFSDVWRRVIWQTPSLNYEQKYPVNNAALNIHKQQTKAAQLTTLREISKDWGIFFFFRSDCPYCHIMAQTLTLLNAEHGLTITPVSLDGAGLPQYPNPRTDNGLATQLGVDQVPFMVLGNVRNQKLIPIGSGVFSSQEMVERIHILTATQPGESY